MAKRLNYKKTYAKDLERQELTDLARKIRDEFLFQKRARQSKNYVLTDTQNVVSVWNKAADLCEKYKKTPKEFVALCFETQNKYPVYPGNLSNALMLKALQDDSTDYYSTSGQSISEYVDDEFKKLLSLTSSHSKKSVCSDSFARIRGSCLAPWFRILIAIDDEIVVKRYFEEAQNQIRTIPGLRLELESRGYPVKELFHL